MIITLLFDSYTAIGTRSQNDDAYYAEKVGDNSWLFIVADGLGGHDKGRVAANTAIDSVVRSINNCNMLDWNKIVEAANSAVRIAQKEMHSDMKTTIAIVYVDEKSTVAVHVGDTRIYAFKSGQIVYQSRDHSVSQMAVAVGEIEPDEIRTHIDRNILTRSLGCNDIVRPDIKLFDNASYDALLLCSDGFWEYVYESEMRTCYNKETPADWLSRLKCICNTRGQRCKEMDNNTAVAVIKGN